MKGILLLILAICAFSAGAQNLVLNPSFEEYDDCAYTCSMVYTPMETDATVLKWHRPSNGTSDYFNLCAPADYLPTPVSIPANFAGYQYPRTGEAYAGFYAVMDIGIDSAVWYREYVEAPLSTPLIAGHNYYVRYWLNLAFDHLNFTTGYDQFGAYLSNGYVWDTTFQQLPYTPQIKSPEEYVYTDTTNWQMVSGTFVADGGEDWIVLGNFTPVELLNDTKIFYIPEWGDVFPTISYYYLDDVCVLDLDGPPTESTITEVTIVCQGDTAELKGREGAATYYWSDNSTGSSIHVNEAGKYWVKSVDTTTCSFFTDTFRVIHKLAPVAIDLGNDTTICKDSAIVLDVSDTTLNNYQWSTGETTASIVVRGAGVYSVTATSECNTATDTITITTAIPPVAGLPGDTILCSGASISLSNKQEGKYYLWNTGDTTCCIAVSDPGNYVITVFNECYESATDETNVLFSGCDNCVTIPNAFSPNGDGINDIYKIYTNCLFKSYKLSIFNRWGQLVFTSAKPDEGWDGTFGGQLLDVGTYFYYLEATPLLEEAGKMIRQKGDITLIR